MTYLSYLVDSISDGGMGKQRRPILSNLDPTRYELIGSCCSEETGSTATQPSLLWRHNGDECVSNHQPHSCLLNRLFRRRSRKHQSSSSLAFVWGIHRSPVNSPHKWPVTRKMFPFDDVIMSSIFSHYHPASGVTQTFYTMRLADCDTICESKPGTTI